MRQLFSFIDNCLLVFKNNREGAANIPGTDQLTTGRSACHSAREGSLHPSAVIFRKRRLTGYPEWEQHRSKPAAVLIRLQQQTESDQDRFMAGL